MNRSSALSKLTPLQYHAILEVAQGSGNVRFHSPNLQSPDQLEGVSKFHVPGLYIPHQQLESTARRDCEGHGLRS